MSKNNKHTPGPWGWVRPGINESYYIMESELAPDKQAIAKVFKQSDATLMAAAPELLEAAKNMLHCKRYHQTPCRECTIAMEQKITKAEGES